MWTDGIRRVELLRCADVDVSALCGRMMARLNCSMKFSVSWSALREIFLALSLREVELETKSFISIINGHEGYESAAGAVCMER